MREPRITRTALSLSMPAPERVAFGLASDEEGHGPQDE